MEAVAATAAPAVEQLAARAQAGDRQAFVSICALHFERVFDFVLRLVRDRSMAADVSRSVFAQARDHEEFQEAKPWLYAVARSTALAALRDRRRPRGTGQREREGLDFTRVDAGRLSDVSRVLFDKELVGLVWDSAATLSPEDYSLLDLHVRQDLPPEALRECGACQESGRGFVSPTEMFGALATMPAPQGLRKELLEVNPSRRTRRFGIPVARTGD